jgi:hypothetical protein
MITVLSATIFDILYDLKNYINEERIKQATIYVIDGESNSSLLLNEEREHLLNNLITKNDQISQSFTLKLIRSFSAYKNIQKLFHISKHKDENQLTCLHGIRFLSLMWVILGHSYVFVVLYSDNIAIFGEWIKRFSFLLIINGIYSVDTFFLIRFVLLVSIVFSL